MKSPLESTMSTNIPLFKIYEDEDDIDNVTAVIRRGYSWANGVEISEFEERIADYIGTRYSVTFNSGTSAMHAMLIATGIGQGDEIIVPSFTFIATANAPLFVNSKPVFADIEEKTYGIDPEDIKERITPKTKAIMPIHFAGCPCMIEDIKEIAEDYNLLLFEDAAEAFGAKVGNKLVGSFGDVGVLSFCQNKIITTGEGGAIVTDSKELYEKLRLIRSHGRVETKDYFSTSEQMEYVTLGYNFRMPSMNAALGISQIKKVDEIIKMRRNNAEYMDRKLEKISCDILPFKLDNKLYHVYQMYSIRVSEEIHDDLIDYLSDNGISCKVYFVPIHESIFYRKYFGYSRGILPITEKVSREILTLPMFPTLTEQEMDYITEKIGNYLGDKK